MAFVDSPCPLPSAVAVCRPVLACLPLGLVFCSPPPPLQGLPFSSRRSQLKHHFLSSPRDHLINGISLLQRPFTPYVKSPPGYCLQSIIQHLKLFPTRVNATRTGSSNCPQPHSQCQKQRLEHSSGLINIGGLNLLPNIVFDCCKHQSKAWLLIPQQGLTESP